MVLLIENISKILKFLVTKLQSELETGIVFFINAYTQRKCQLADCNKKCYLKQFWCIFSGVGWSFIPFLPKCLFMWLFLNGFCVITVTDVRMVLSSTDVTEGQTTPLFRVLKVL